MCVWISLQELAIVLGGLAVTQFVRQEHLELVRDEGGPLARPATCQHDTAYAWQCQMHKSFNNNCNRVSERRR